MLDSYILISSGLSRIRTQIIRCKGQSLDSSQSKLKCLISKMFHVINKILFMQNILFTSMYGANRIQMEKFNTLLTNVSIKSCLSCCTFLSQGGWVNRLRNIFTLLVYFSWPGERTGEGVKHWGGGGSRQVFLPCDHPSRDGHLLEAELGNAASRGFVLLILSLKLNTTTGF